MKTTLCFKLIFTSALIVNAFGFSCNKEEISASVSERGFAPKVAAIYCSSAAFSTNATAGTEYSGTARVPYTGGNGADYSKEVTIASTGVTGLTAKLQAGTLASGFGNLMYTINGVPAASGTAYFILGFGGQTCTLQLIVGK
jgi:hypothetical protein